MVRDESEKKLPNQKLNIPSPSITRWQKTCAEIMSGDVITLPPQASALEAAKTMVTREVGSVLVDEPGQDPGIVSELDLCSLTFRGDDPEATLLEDLATTPLITAGADDTLYTAAAKLARHAIRHLPIVNNSGSVVGILSDRDLLSYCAEAIEFAQEMIQNEEARMPATAAELCHSPVIVTRSISLQEAAGKLKLSRDECVFDESDGGIGILTASDISRAISEEAAIDATSEPWFSRPVRSCEKTLSVAAVGHLMEDSGYRHLAVMDDDRLIGAISDIHLIHEFAVWLNVLYENNKLEYLD